MRSSEKFKVTFTFKRLSTVYITFGGPAASVILSSLEMNISALYTEMDQVSFANVIGKSIHKADLDTEFSGYESADPFAILRQVASGLSLDGAKSLDEHRKSQSKPT